VLVGDIVGSLLSPGKGTMTITGNLGTVVKGLQQLLLEYIKQMQLHLLV
jgi:ATP-dependent Lon protease